jgi:uncharacterized membrane protein
MKSNRLLQLLLALLLALGILFRFVNLEQKPYWHDEIFTLLRISGYRDGEAAQKLYTGQVMPVKAMLRYQQPSEKSVLATVASLATEEPHHPPLYYAIARLWSGWFGSSVTAIRSLPLVFSLLAFPALYWLAQELFATPTISWLAVALLSVSPIFVRYAQEAREYSLWVVATMLSGAALLQAMRRQRPGEWLIYALAIALAFYSHLLSVYVVLAQAIYVVLLERFRPTKTLICYSLATALGVALFSPWLWVVWQNQQTMILTTNWMKRSIPLVELLRLWGVQLCRLFIAWHFQYDRLLVYLAIPMLILVGVALFRLCRQTSKRIWLFVMTLIVIPALPLMLPDILWGGTRSINARYFLPSYIGILLAIADLLNFQLTQRLTTALQPRLWQIIAAIIITSSVITCAVTSQASTWWGWSEFDVEASRLVNQFPRPLVIADGSLGTVLPLSHRLKADAGMLLLSESHSLTIPQGYESVFIYNPSDRLQSKLKQQGIAIKPVYQFRDSDFVVTLYCKI